VLNLCCVVPQINMDYKHWITMDRLAVNTWTHAMLINFTRLDSLSRHTIGDKQYKCEQCMKSFSSNTMHVLYQYIHLLNVPCMIKLYTCKLGPVRNIKALMYIYSVCLTDLGYMVEGR
jgi:hypothetical protein